ncbi:MAG: transposase [Patescibacteria group bacterium]
MPRPERNFADGEYYHITLRRAGEEEMFLDESDHYRGIYSLFEFNSKSSVIIQKKRRNKRDGISGRGSPPTTYKEELVELVAFCFMPNHVHLLLTPVCENGVTLFISKFASGYPAYFKHRYEIKRKGHFFQDRFHSVHISNDDQLRVVFMYIHLNPVSLIFPKWKEGERIRAKEAFDFCANYKWSSFRDYLGEKNFPSVTNRKFMNDFMGGAKGCKEEAKNWLKHKEKMFSGHQDILIE